MFGMDRIAIKSCPIAERGDEASIIGARQLERIEADREALHLRNDYCQVAEEGNMLFASLLPNFRSIFPDYNMSEHRSSKDEGASKELLQEAIKPGNCALKCIDTMTRLTQCMTFARVTDENSLHSPALQGHVHLFRLCDVNIVVLLAVNEKRRRLRLSNVTKR